MKDYAGFLRAADDAESPIGIDAFQQDRIRWATRAANGEALVAVVSTHEVALVVKEYLYLLDDIDTYATKEEQRNLSILRSLAIGRVEEFVAQGAIDRATVDTISRETLGRPFPFERESTAFPVPI